MCKELKEAFLEYRNNFLKILKMQVILSILSMISFAFLSFNEILGSLLGMFLFSFIGVTSLIFYRDVNKADIVRTLKNSFGSIMLKYLGISVVMFLIIMLFFPILSFLITDLLLGKTTFSTFFKLFIFSSSVLLILIVFVYPPAKLIETNSFLEAISIIRDIRYFKKGILYVAYMFLLILPLSFMYLLPYLDILTTFLLLFCVYPIMSIIYWKIYYME